MVTPVRCKRNYLNLLLLHTLLVLGIYPCMQIFPSWGEKLLFTPVPLSLVCHSAAISPVAGLGVLKSTSMIF